MRERRPERDFQHLGQPERQRLSRAERQLADQPESQRLVQPERYGDIYRSAIGDSKRLYTRGNHPAEQFPDSG